ncbi:enoyl-CoA hydratase/isomerase family protein [Bacillus alveayuensis]|uniref:enoyl-CoA hydratase/isomerase family protein n=1 Tax=Aeribacillus alveayuensis TaxID=279215 RepID=UPI001F48DDA9|nr:enoyl-CoA hydratase/isomerase family protein [Bacillus alveayuensis]
MNRPEKLNALSKNMVADLIEAFDVLSKDGNVRVIILSGKGKSFCAGGDISSMSGISSSYEASEWIEYVSSLSRKIVELDKYVIAAVHGYAAGAGFSLALACDFIIAERGAKFALSFTNIGLIPDLGLIRMLSERISPPIAKEWISSGKEISAEEAFEKDIINRVTDQSVVSEAKSFAEFIINGPMVTNKYVKYLINHIKDLPLDSTFMKENMIQTMLLLTDDHREGIKAFFEKRKPTFKGR